MIISKINPNAGKGKLSAMISRINPDAIVNKQVIKQAPVVATKRPQVLIKREPNPTPVAQVSSHKDLRTSPTGGIKGLPILQVDKPPTGKIADLYSPGAPSVSGYQYYPQSTEVSEELQTQIDSIVSQNEPNEDQAKDKKKMYLVIALIIIVALYLANK